MFYKLALQNVKKSIRDYTIYFLTLTFGVCLFYAFNSLDSQEVMHRLTSDSRDIMEMLVNMLGGISIFISVILGFLIIYANRFLMKRRKKELGIYMTLGMRKFTISRILTIETLVIGIFSLAVGLIAGVFAAQGLSVLTAQMFEVRLDEFHFVFSNAALIKTLIYFGIIFLVVMLFNGITVSKFKLINLLNAAKKNETLRVKSLWLSVVLFILAVACLATAYTVIIQVGLFVWNNTVLMCIILGIIGTFLFFLSLSGFLLRAVKGCKTLYYKGLNMFILRQINSKVTTTFISMTLICLMLFVTICVLSSGKGIADTSAATLKEVTPYDVSVYNIYDNENVEQGKDLRGYFTGLLKDNGVLDDDIVKSYATLDLYVTDLQYNQLLKYYGKELNGQVSNEMYEKQMEYHPEVIPLTQFNEALKLQGKGPIELSGSQAAIVCNYSDTMPAYEELLKSGDTIKIFGKEYTLYPTLVEAAYYTTGTPSIAGSVVVPDETVKDILTPIREYVNVQLKGDVGKNSQILSDRCDRIEPDESNYYTNTSCLTKSEMYDQSKGMSVVATYIAIYIGIIFLITSAAILALQQLSESSDNQERYRLLRKIGTDPKMINRSVFMQVFITFMLPLLLAMIHSIVGITVANQIIQVFGKVDALGGIIAAAAAIVLVYGGYMLATYFGCKSMVKK